MGANFSPYSFMNKEFFLALPNDVTSSDGRIFSVRKFEVQVLWPCVFLDTMASVKS